MDNNHEAGYTSIWILNQLPGFLVILRRLLTEAEMAEKTFSRGQSLTHAQCIRETDALFKLDNTIGELDNLFSPLSIFPDRSLTILKILSELRPPLEELKNIVAKVGESPPYRMSETMKGEALRYIRSFKTNLDKIITQLQEVTASQSVATTQEPPQSLFVEPVSPANVITIYPSSMPGSDELSLDPGCIVQLSMQETVSSLSPSDNSDFFFQLYDIVKPLPSLELREICLKLAIEYSSLEGTSEAERALSLAESMKRQKRLGDLHKELRRRFPGRF